MVIFRVRVLVWLYSGLGLEGVVIFMVRVIVWLYSGLGL